MSTLSQDLRYGVRSFLKRPGFLVIAVSTLALGIGATTAMFTVVNSVLLRPLQFPEPERIVLLQGVNPRQGITDSSMSAPDIADWRQQSQSFEQIASFVTVATFLATGEDTQRLRTAVVSAEFFPVFRTNAIHGRWIDAGEALEGAQSVALISHALWQRSFGGAANVVNSKVTISGEPTTIVGIMPPGFNFPDDSELWIALQLDPATEARDNRAIN
ncbi:MAG TPA: ABC transporter permease, partial [Pyrinomonadaceae bacterium]|nr:ABC transporter permease [Pyrinomonadaceae bacterium]